MFSPLYQGINRKISESSASEAVKPSQQLYVRADLAFHTCHFIGANQCQKQMNVYKTNARNQISRKIETFHGFFGGSQNQFVKLSETLAAGTGYRKVQDPLGKAPAMPARQMISSHKDTSLMHHQVLCLQQHHFC